MISILHEHFVIFSFLFLLCFGIIYKFSMYHNYPSIKKSSTIIAVLILCSALIIMLNEFPIDSTLYNTLFVKDKISLSIEIIMTAIFLIICISTWKYNKIENIPQLEYLIISIATLLSICLLITVEEMFAFYLILEFQSITLYVLASLKKNKHSIEAAIKYLIMGSFASILFLLGFSFIYSVSGLTHFEDLLFFLQNQKEDSQIDQYICYGLLFMSIGLFFKTYIVPMHLWVSDIYELAPTSSVMIFATTSALPYYFIFYKMYGILFANYQWFWKPLLIVVCVSSIVIGTVGALYQYSIKRLIAYSSITNTGYMFLSLILYESPLLITNAFFYIILYTLNLLGLFTLLNHLYYKETNGHSYFIQNIYQLNGLYDKNKILSLFFMIYFYTLAGLPPFSFFFAKIYLFTSLMYQQKYMWLIIVLAIATIIAVFYYIRVVQLIYFNKRQENYTIQKIPFYITFINTCILLINFFYCVTTSDTFLLIQYITFELYT